MDMIVQTCRILKEGEAEERIIPPAKSATYRVNSGVSWQFVCCQNLLLANLSIWQRLQFVSLAAKPGSRSRSKTAQDLSGLSGFPARFERFERFERFGRFFWKNRSNRSNLA